MQYILALLSVPFFYSNYKILVSDLKYKKIPNKYLLYLLALIPFYYIYLFLYFPEINYLFFLWQIIITFTISFILYIFWIWAAWNAKYLLILSLFLPYIWIIPLIWNIVLLAIIYLILYFIWFYFWKCIIIKWYAKSLIWNIKIDLHEKWENYSYKKWWNTFFIILKWLISFLILFVSFRLLRIYVFDSLVTWNSSWLSILKEIIEKYNIYLILLFILIWIWIMYIVKLLINKFVIDIASKFKINTNLIWNIFLIVLFIFLISFIYLEFLIAPNQIILSLYKIFTLYIIIYLLFKIIIFSYKITFVVNQSQFINIKDLREWSIIDKSYLINLFWNQKILWASEKDENWNIDATIKKYILRPNPKKYFKSLFWPLNIKNVNIIKKCYTTVNQYQKLKIKWYKENNKIKILNSISFWIYIFLWFIITYLSWNKIIIFILNKIILMWFNSSN